MDEAIYKALSDQLATITEVKHVDLWDNQVDNDAHENSYPRPAVFIDFEEVDWSDASRGPQTGVMRVGFHIVQESLSELYTGSVDQAAAMAVFCLPKLVNKAMQHFSGEWFGPLARTQTKRDKSVASQIIFIATYQCVITDNSGAQDQDYVEGSTLTVAMGHPGEVPAPPDPPEDCFTIPLS